MPAPSPPPADSTASVPPPRWARIADFACLVLVVFAVILAMWGGIRVRIGGLRLALTSPYRLLIWAAGLAVVRHFMAPQAPIYRDLPARVAAAWRTPAGRTAVSALVGTRAAVIFVGYLAVVMVGYREGGPPWRVTDNEFGNLQARFDTGWYLGIAVEGYTFTPNRPEYQQNVVFFPALPMLMRATGRLLGDAPTAYVWGGTSVALLAFLGALIYLFRFARDLLEDEDQARYAVWFLAAYPFALFYSAVYTESLFLLGALGAFYHFTRAEYRRAALWGLLVGLTRPNGCFLSVPLALLAFTPWLPAWLVGGPGASRPAAAAPRQDVRVLVPALAAAAMPGVGVLIYSAYVWSLTGDPLAWAAGHVAWGRQYQGLTILVSDRYQWLAESGVYEYTSKEPGDLLNVLGAIFVLAAAWPVARRVGLAYAAFILLNILPPLAAGGFLSAGRFSSVLFPAFVWFAAAIPARHRLAWLASFMALQAFNATLFYTWRSLY